MEESLSQAEMEELKKDFLDETEDMLENIDQCFIKLEESPDDLSLINEIFRAIHSIKGSAGFLGFKNLVDIAHHTENVLNKIRQNELNISPEVIDIVLEAVDVIKLIVKNIKEGTDQDINLKDIQRKLELLLDYANLSADSASESATESSSQNVSRSEKVDSGKAESTGSQQIQTSSPPPEKESPSETTKPSEETKDQTIRIDTQRLDHVMDLVGELVLSRNRLNKLISHMENIFDGDERFRAFMETVSNLNIITSDLQLAVMKMRMIPVKKVFNKFPRMVRDLARKANKKVQLNIYGETTEVDKSVIEELNDPLIHILRNAVDHGIEPPEERLKKGKPECGTITLGAFQEGNSIVIEVEDDGKGIDPVEIEKKAREKGILSGDIKLSEKEIINLIFEPGFSTAQKVTDISGRGVGMDVVKTNLSKINGVIDLHSEKGKGTKMILRIPLTLAIIQVLMVKVNGEMYALPLSSILETFKVTRDKIKYIDGQEILTIRDRMIPLLRLKDALGIYGDSTEGDSIYVVVMTIAEKRIGIIVDELCHQEEVVIKSVGSYFSDIREIAGATITGDGKISLILDPVSLIYNR